MRVQVMHQTVYEIGKPRQTAIILSDRELELMFYVLGNVQETCNYEIADFASELYEKIHIVAVPNSPEQEVGE